MNQAKTLHCVFLLAAPILVAWAGWSTATAIGLVLLLLLWRWLITLVSISRPTPGPELILDTISASHFVEKVRWSMDLLGLEYTERPCGGTLGAFFVARTVPRLRFKTGIVDSSIGNSAEILRYLWGRYQATLGPAAEFLQADAERLELEQQIDRCGRDLQVWVYYHILPHRSLTLHAWGVNNPEIPLWQRISLRVLFPVLRLLIRRAFSINEQRYQKAIQHMDELLSVSESLLKEQDVSLLPGNGAATGPNYVDITFAAINGLWLQPLNYGGGRADNVRINREDTHPAMRADIERWIARYPLSVAFMEKLYVTRPAARG